MIDIQHGRPSDGKAYGLVESTSRHIASSVSVSVASSVVFSFGQGLPFSLRLGLPLLFQFRSGFHSSFRRRFASWVLIHEANCCILHLHRRAQTVFAYCPHRISLPYILLKFRSQPKSFPKPCTLNGEVEMLRRRVVELEEQNRTLHSQATRA